VWPPFNGGISMGVQVEKLAQCSTNTCRITRKFGCHNLRSYLGDTEGGRGTENEKGKHDRLDARYPNPPEKTQAPPREQFSIDSPKSRPR
jgi:hypothetical protein